MILQVDWMGMFINFPATNEEAEVYFHFLACYEGGEEGLFHYSWDAGNLHMNESPLGDIFQVRSTLDVE